MDDQTLRQFGRTLADQVVRDVVANSFLNRTLRPGCLIPAGRGWAANDEVTAYVVDAVSRLQEGYVITELGSGVSTAWFGLAAKRWPGRVVSIEHDERWLGKTRALLQRLDVESVVELQHAPLVPQEAGPDWYGLPNTLPAQIDVLFVDGPPGDVGKHVRRPAAEQFSSRLSPGAMVVLDDTIRVDESEVLASWLEDQDLRLEVIEKLGGATILRYHG